MWQPEGGLAGWIQARQGSAGPSPSGCKVIGMQQPVHALLWSSQHAPTSASSAHAAGHVLNSPTTAPSAKPCSAFKCLSLKQLSLGPAVRTLVHSLVPSR